MTTAFCESPNALSDSELRARFVYWRGASGKRHLHTVYALHQIPEIDIAVVLLVRCLPEGKRRVLRVIVSTSRAAEGRALLFAMAEEATADEVHVHALARNETEARRVARDLTHAVAMDWANVEPPKRSPHTRDKA